MKNIVEIDKEKCRKDGVCVADCPVKILTTGEDGYPAPIQGAEDLCIDCGHCVACCPQHALSQHRMLASTCNPIRGKLKVSLEEAEQFLTGRRSIRQYKSTPVEREKIEQLLRIAGYAPSGHNVQPARWLVIGDAGQVRNLASLVAEWMVKVDKEQPDLARLLHLDRVLTAWTAGEDRILRSAPHLIVGYAPINERTAPAAIIAAIAYVDLASPALGLGTCWAGYFNSASQSYEPLQKALGLPMECSVYGAVMIGYPKVRYYRIPKRKPIDVIWR